MRKDIEKRELFNNKREWYLKIKYNAFLKMIYYKYIFKWNSSLLSLYEVFRDEF